MITKPAVFGFALVSAISAQAAAHEPQRPGAHGSTYSSEHRAPNYPREVRRAGPSYPAHAERHDVGYAGDFRRADYDHDGWVTPAEARAHSRAVFERVDLDRNRVLGRRELRQAGNQFQRQDRDRDGRVSYREYEVVARHQFTSLDRNRDGLLSARERGVPGPVPRHVGWRR
jgi:hypothetical protein